MDVENAAKTSVRSYNIVASQPPWKRRNTIGSCRLASIATDSLARRVDYTIPQTAAAAEHERRGSRRMDAEDCNHRLMPAIASSMKESGGAGSPASPAFNAAIS